MSPRERTTYNRFKHRLRRAVGQRLVTLAVAVLPRIYLAYMWFVFATSRVHMNNFLDLNEISRKYDGAVAALWHEEVATVAYAYGRYAGVRGHTLASQGDAGRLITRMLELCGYVVFRGGSSSKRSRRNPGVLRAMIEHMNENHEVIYGLTVDGSQGPPYRMKEGAIIVAQRCGKPMLLGRTWYKRCIRLNTWDRTAIPLPFNEIAFYMRGPYPVPEDADTQEGFEAFRQYLEDELVDLAKQSYLDLGQVPPHNLIKRSEEPA
jgi:lysophospholipid acyltransferase (LPLAT)-like uncharacterized protein